MVPNCKVHGKEDATVPHNIRAGVEIRDDKEEPDSHHYAGS